MNWGITFGSAAAGAVGGGMAVWAALVLPKLLPTISNETQATLLTGLLAVGVAILATLIAIWGVISQRAITRRQVTFDQMARSEADGSFQRARRVFNDEARKEQGLAPWADKDREGTEEQQAIVTVLNDFELYSIGLQRGIIDAALYRGLNRGTVLFAWKNAQPFVVRLRQRLDRPLLYHEFEEMARWMSLDKPPHRSFWWTGLF